MKTMTLLAFACTAIAASTTAQTFYIDPTAGVDVVGGGTVAQPLRTMTFAATQAVAGQTLTMMLQPGTYGRASGESFPIVLPANVTIEGVLAQGARIRNEVPNPTLAPAIAALRVDLGASVLAGAITLRNLTLFGNQQGVRIQATDGVHSLDMDNVTTQMLGPTAQNAGVGVHVIANGPTQTTTIIANLRAVVSTDRAIGLWLRTTGYAQIFGSIDDSRYTAEPLATALPSGTALRMESSDSSSIGMDLGNTAIYHRVRGVEVRQFDTSAQYLATQYCAFYDCGLTSFVSPFGQVFEGGVVSHVAGALTNCVVDASAFYGNTVELPDYSAASYTVHDSLLQEPTLAALPSNLSGNPLWVDAAAGDYHLLPGSPCRNVVPTSSTPAVDADGDDRLSGCAGATDIGVDESFDRDLYFASGNVVGVGGTVVTNLYGDGGSIAFVAAGVPSWAPCSASQINVTGYVQLGSVTMPGAPGAREFATLSFVVPNSPSLIGNAYAITAAFVTDPAGIPGLEYAANLRHLSIVN